MAQSYIERWADEALDPDMTWDPKEETKEQLLRLENDIQVVRYCLGMKRRLGQDASREELSIDKKLARRTLARLIQSYVNHKGDRADLEKIEGKFTNDQKVAGAQLNWEQWWLQHVIDLREAMRHIATNGKATAHIKATNQLLARCEWELIQLADVHGTPDEIREINDAY